MRRIHAFVLSAVLAAGCDSVSNRQLEATHVVESVLIAGQPMPPLLLSRVGDIDTKYLFESYAESGADVSVRVTGPLLNETIRYEESDGLSGVYIPVNFEKPVLPLHRYELAIQPASSAPLITASTVVPDTFSLVSASPIELVYQGGEQLELRITPSQHPGREQSYFIFVTEALSPSEQNLVPLAREIYDGGEGEALEELRVSGSPIVNEDNYKVHDDGTLGLRYPWIGINFFGANIVYINALDDNVYNFERSRSVQEGGSTFAPGEIPNPLSHIAGAHGLFGSLARVSVRFSVIRP